MSRPITLFTGQWADLSLEELARKVNAWGYDGLELACLPNHFDYQKILNQDGYVDSRREILKQYDLTCYALGAHQIGQCVCDDPIDERHRGIISDRLWGDGDPEGVRQRCTEAMKDVARAAKRFGVHIVNGFTGSSIWRFIYPYPPVSEADIEAGFRDFAERWTPILDVFAENEVKFGLEVHPTEIAFDIVTARRALEAVDYHPAFGFNFDPSHFVHQFVDPVAFIHEFGDRIWHVHVKDARTQLDGRTSILASHLPFGDYRRGWDFVSPGRGDVRWDPIVRALNRVGYDGPLSVEWEDNGMNREWGAQEALEMVRRQDFEPSDVAFEAGFAET